MPALCTLATSPNLGHLFSFATCFIGRLVIPLIFAVAVVMFIWGVVQYVIHDDEEAKKDKGKQFMVWGIIALTVMISVWGLVGIVGRTFGLNTSVLPQVSPSAGTSSSPPGPCPGGGYNCP